MKILLTLDIFQPNSFERGSNEALIRTFWDRLQATSKHQVELVLPKAKEGLPTAWAEEAFSLEKAETYRLLAPSPLESYDLIIGVNLPSNAEAFFNSLGKKYLVVRQVPCEVFRRFVLLRANFQIPKTLLGELPAMKEIFTQKFPLGEVPKQDRGWWLANRFLVNVANRSLVCHQEKDRSLLFTGTTLFQSERLIDGKLMDLTSYDSKIRSLLAASPNFYYHSEQPFNAEEIRYMKTFSTAFPSLSLPQLLARDELDSLISLDAGLAPVATAFNKSFVLLGKDVAWSVVAIRQFGTTNFLENFLNHEC